MKTLDTSFRQVTTRLILLVGALAVTACPPPPTRRVVVPIAVEQWRSVQVQYPYVAAAYLESLIALAGDSPNGLDRGRDQAFELARQSGLVKGQRPLCVPCDAAKEAEMHRYVVCLSVRLQCLQSR